MGIWNYVVTALKPTSVTHSCVGNFTSPRDRNLIIAKCTRIEIHLFSPQGLRLMLDVPIYGRITTLELFRPAGEAQDSLFIATERYKYCILRWDPETSDLVTWATGEVSDRLECPTYNGQIGIIDPACRLIGLHLYEGFFEVIPFDENGLLKEAFNIRVDQLLQVLDIKFLYGCREPTIVVLCQDQIDTRYVRAYEVDLEDKNVVQCWSSEVSDNGADLLIPLLPPICGVLIIGRKTITHYSSNGSHCKSGRFNPSITKAYGRDNSSRYLLGYNTGFLCRLELKKKGGRVTGFKLDNLGHTSIASTISCLDNDNVYIGSSSGDSQLIRINQQPDENSFVEVLEQYVNLGPIGDFCVVQGQGQVVTCSGADKDGSLRIVSNCNGIRIDQEASVELEGIKGMWSLSSSTHDTFLVLSFINETKMFAMNDNEELEETEIEGFSSQVQTLVCHEAIHNQHVQVTSSSVRLVRCTTRELRDEWHAPRGYSVNVATANHTQVLLATKDGNLFYLKIGDGILEEVKHANLEYEISCLDINPIGKNRYQSSVAAVGMWTENSVGIFSLPDLKLITKEQLGEIPRSVLLCDFEGISYLLCALGDGCLLNFMLNTSTGELTDRKKVSRGTQPITLRTFQRKLTTYVFAASDRPTVVFSSNKKLLYHDVFLKEVRHMCSFDVSFKYRWAIAMEDKLIIGEFHDIHKLPIHSIPLGEQARRICHQEKSGTFAICSLKCTKIHYSEESESHTVELRDDRNFELKSTYELHTYEYGCFIISCSFSDDNNVYYCVGTAYVLAEENEPTKGRILVFTVEDGTLQLIAEKETKGAVYCLNAFNGRLLAAINKKIRLYKLVLLDDGTHELKFECGHRGHILALYVLTRGDFIVVGDLVKSISLLIYKHAEGANAIEEIARDYNANWMSAAEILDDDIYLGAGINFNLFTVRKNSEGATDEERGRCEVVGEYHLGEFVNRFRHGSLVKGLPDSDVGRIPTLIFGTINGMLGVIASLPHEQYVLLEKLQSNLRKVIKGVGGFSHEQWRSVNNENKTVEARNFLDGDLIESYLDLNRTKKNIISKAMGVSVEELCTTVEELTRLH